MNLINKLFYFLTILSVVFLARAVHAAPLNYDSDTIISLSSPAINFTIQSGSVADSVVVNAGNVVVSMSTSTSGIFTLISYSRDVAVEASADGGNIEKTCSGAYLYGGAMTLVIAHASGSSATYTITPTDSQCIVPAFSGGVGHKVEQLSSQPPISGGGAPIAAQNIVSATTTTVVSAATTTASAKVESLQNQIISLQALLKSLIEQVAQKQKGAQGSVKNFEFTRDLYFGLAGDDVKTLQSFLVGQNAGLAAQKLGEAGATGKFFWLTKNALAEFQKSVGISPANGYFGPKTRAYIQK